MKKFLSVALSTAMAFSMFANVAFGAELTTQEKFEALKAKGVLNGINGESALNETLTRAQFAKALTTLLGLTSTTTGSAFTDVKATHWAAPSINAAAEAKLVQGVGAGKFAPNQVLTVGAVAKVLTLALKIDAGVKATDTWEVQATAYIAAAVKAGLITAAQSADYKGTANRGVLVDAMYTAWSASQKLNLTTIAQTGAKKITVTFNQAVTDADKKELTYEVKNGLVPYGVTAKYADDNKSVVLEATFLPAADYTVTVKGFEAKTVKVEDEKYAKLEIGAATLQYADDQDLKVKALNQFNEEIAYPTLNITAFNATQGAALADASTGVVDLKTGDKGKVDDNIVVTVLQPSTGLSATKTFKVVAGSSATVVQLSTVAPLKDKTRISVNESGLILPYKLADQYGQAITLPLTTSTALTAIGGNLGTITIGGITFVVSDRTIVDDFAVDKDGVLTFKTKANAGNVVITAANNNTGATASTTLKVEASATVKTFQLSNPGKLVVTGEEVALPFVAADTYGVAIAAKDLVLSQITFNSSNTFAAGYPKLNAKGELVVKFTGTGTTYLYAYIGGAVASQLQLDVKAASAPVRVNGIKDVVTTYAVNASNDFDADNITVVDNYGRVSNVATAYTVSSSNTAVVTTTGNKLTAVAAGSAEISVSLNSSPTTTLYKFTVTVVAASDIKSFEIKTIGAVYADPATVPTATYNKTVELVGKLANGTTVAIVQNDYLNFVTSSDESVITATGVTLKGKKAGTATVSAWNGSTKVAETTVTVSEAAPVAKSAAFVADEYAVALAGTTATSVEVKDQYGVVITPVGYYSSNDTTVATVNATTGVVTGVKKGTATITYVTSNGTTDTAFVLVD